MKLPITLIRNKKYSTSLLWLQQKQRNFSIKSSNENGNQQQKICVIGSGPAGFYASQYLLKNLPNASVDMIEKLPIPYGLVRYGVAPDHPEVKNVINTFSKTGENPRFHFYGNLCLGKDITIKELRERYHIVLLTYGAEIDRKLNLPNEDNNKNVLSAREFVAWYNGLPGYQNLQLNLNETKTATIIGQGNVGIDAARILLTPIEKLKTTDITQYALDALSENKIEKVYLIGRRGPLQAAFTIKELREMLKLPGGVVTKWRSDDFKCCTNEILSQLQRPRKRLTELMLKSLEDQQKELSSSSADKNQKQFLPIFMRSPISIKSDNTLELSVNRLENDKAIPTNDVEVIETNLILRSIGYKSINVDLDLNFDEKNGYIRNINGRVLKMNSNDVDYGLYVAGWLGTGPIGVILTTMNGAFAVANTICEDIKTNRIPCCADNEIKIGLEKILRNHRIVTWNGWKRIDKYEIENGKKFGKPREKIVDIEKMLQIAGV